MTSFHDAPDEWMEDDEAMEERSTMILVLEYFLGERYVPGMA